MVKQNALERAVAAGPPAPDAPPPPRPMKVGPGLLQDLRDALVLLSYAAGAGGGKEGPPHVPAQVIHGIIDTAARPGITEAAPGTENRADTTAATPGEITTDAWAAYITAYQTLAQIMAPVTASTLRATGQTAEGRGRWGLSRAGRFNALLWLISLAFAGSVIFVDWSQRLWGPALDGRVTINDGALNAWSI